VDTIDHINIKCRLNSNEDHIWHTPHSQLNLIVDLLYNFYITWGKRQDDIDQNIERLNKEYQHTK
jgi:hypothetical protein